MKVDLFTEFWVLAKRTVDVKTEDVEILNGRVRFKLNVADKIFRAHDGVHNNFIEILSEAPCLSGWKFAIDEIDGWELGEIRVNPEEKVLEVADKVNVLHLPLPTPGVRICVKSDWANDGKTIISLDGLSSFEIPAGKSVWFEPADNGVEWKAVNPDV